MPKIIVHCAICGLISLLPLAPAAWSAQSSSEIAFSVQPLPLFKALNVWARQAKCQLIWPAGDPAEEKPSGPLVGTYAPEQALAKLLEGSGLEFQFLDEETVQIRRVGSGKTSASAGGKNESLIQMAQGSGALRSTPTNSTDTNTGGGGGESSGSEKLEEIIVTATKREEMLQDIPMSVAVIDNEAIERRGLIGMEDYLRSVPGVNQIDNGAFSNAIVIRGISTSPEFENFGSGATVATYFDETPITGVAGLRGGNIDVRPVDIERIEVLRGPQGTAYGSGSLGGAMRIIPAKPDLTGFGARLAGSYSETGGAGSENSMVQGMLNVPVATDKLAVRAVGYRYDESGFYRNIAGDDPATLAAAQLYGLDIHGYVQDDVGRMVSTGVRLGALWQATEKLSFSVNFLTQKIEQDGQPFAGVGKFEQAHLPTAPQARVRGLTGEASDTDMDLANLVINYDLGWATVTSALSSVDGGAATAYDYYPFYRAPVSNSYDSDIRSSTAELRLATRLPGRWQFLGGLFYEDTESKFFNTLDWHGTPAANFAATNPISLYKETRQLDQRAVFGEISYRLTDRLTATMGGRYFDYDRDDTQRSEGGAVPIGTGVTRVLASGENGSSLKASLSFKPGEESLLYASWAEGFRLGRPQAGLPAATCDRNADGLADGTGISIASTRSIDSDYLDNFELGAKFALLDRRLTVDTSIYHIEWDGLPVTSFVASCNTNYTANAGAAESDGVEVQASLLIVPGLTLDFGGGYTRAELAKDAPGLLGSPKKGARLPGSAEVNANLSAQYEFDVSGHRAFVRADSFYTGEFFGDLLQTPGLRAGDYIKLDARAGVAIRNFSIELFVRNITDEDDFTWRSTTVAFAANQPFFGYRLRPRTIGVQLGYDFR